MVQAYNLLFEYAVNETKAIWFIAPWNYDLDLIRNKYLNITLFFLLDIASL